MAVTAIGRPSTESHRTRVVRWLVNDGIWIVVGVAAAAFTVTREAGSLLSRIGDAAGFGYGTDVFTGPTLSVLQTADLAAALQLWTGDPSDADGGVATDVDLATRLLGIHILADLVFIAAYGVILWRILRWVGAGRSFAVGGPLIMTAADLAETTLLALAVTQEGAAATPLLVAIQFFSLIKWTAFGVIVVGAIVNLFRDDRHATQGDVLGFEQAGGRTPLPPDGPPPESRRSATTSADGETTSKSGEGDAGDAVPSDPAADQPSLSTKVIFESVQGARTHGELPPPIAVTGQLIVIGIFCVLIALPGGSALAQTPDVLRVQIDPVIDGNTWPDARPLLLSTLALGLFAVSAVTSAVIGGPVPAARRKTIGTAIPLAVAIIVSGSLAALGFLFDGSTSLAPWASMFVIAAVAIAAWIATLATGDRAEPVTKSESIPSRWQTGQRPEAVGGGSPNVLVNPQGLNRWASALAAVIVIAGGIGLLRASVPIVMLGDRSSWWWAFAALGALVVVTGGVAAQWILSTSIVPRILTGSPRRRLALGTAIVVLIVVLAVWLAVDPAAARFWGTTGAVTIAFSLYVLIIGGLQRVARQGRPWRATQRLGFGVTTPWAFLLLLVWIIGSLLNTKPGYHQIDVLTGEAANASVATDDTGATAAAGTSTGRHESIAIAFDSWLAANETADCGESSTLPLVMVAAPGGGIRAAYWSGTTLEALLPGQCRDRLFIASGTSGGAVGISAWASATTDAETGTTASAPPGDVDQALPTMEAITAMSRDDPLAATVATLLLRDLPQPLTGLRTAWDDRGAVLEQRWIQVTTEAANPDGDADDTAAEAGVFGRPGEPRPMRALGVHDDGWAPIVVLNSASVIDGCRALVTTLDSQPTVGGGDCVATTPVLAPSMMPESSPLLDGDPTGSNPDDVMEPGPGRTSAEAGAGVSGASIDVLDRLTTAGGGCDDAVRARSDLGIASGALMAARWPYITPSGSLRYCLNDDERDLYVVDGGYFENTGLLAVLEVWNELEPHVVAHNATSRNRPIVPWILYLDNSYRQNEPATNVARPPELLVPLRTFFQNQVASPAALQQEAAAAMSSFAAGQDCEAGGYTRLGPEASPEVAAPLGWVLSEASRDSLDGFRDEAIARGGTCLSVLTRLLGVRDQ